MGKVVLVLIVSVLVLCASMGSSEGSRLNRSQEQSIDGRSLAPAIKLTIATYNGDLDRPMNHYRVGDQVSVAITMTNTSAAPVYACVSSTLYQDVPKLTKDGKVMPYMKWQSYEQLTAQRDRTCQDVNLPEPVLLKPNEPQLADWLVLVDSRISTGAEAWYDSLPPGKYELSLQRRLDCCSGPTIESNKISFEIVP